MESSKGKRLLCTICKLRHNDVCAVVWCPECEENLCTGCKEHHDLSRLTKGHNSISVEEYDALSPFIQEIKQHCKDHKEKFDFLCPDDDTLCCRKCITTTHKECKHFMSIEEAIASSRENLSCEAIDKCLECQRGNLENAKKDRESNKKLVIEQKEKFRSDIQNVRGRIKDYLDQLENKIIEELDFSVEMQEKEIQKVIDEITSKQDEVEKLTAEKENLRENDFDLQTFLRMRKLRESVNQSEKCIQTLIDSDRFDRISVEMSIANEISTFLSKIRTLGTIRVIVKPRTVTVQSVKDDKAITNEPVQMASLDVGLQLSTKVQAPKGKQGINVTGCAMSPTGQIYIADFSPSKRLLTVNSDGSFSKDVSFIDTPVFDLTFIDSSIMAISTGSYRKIKIINTTNQNVLQNVTTSGNNYGITSAHGSLIFCVGNQNLQSFNLSDNSVDEIQSGKLKNNAYVCYNDGKLYHTSANGSSIICRDICGNTLWEFQAEQLKEPRGIAVDRNGKIYVVGEASNNLITISADGKQFKEMLTSNDELNKPTAVCCDNRNDILVICNKSGLLFVYKIL